MISRCSLAVAVTLSLLILSSGCAGQHLPAATIPAGTNVANIGGTNTIPPGTSVVPVGKKHFLGGQ